MFSPHVMVIQQGTTVEFLNSDNVQHNAFWTGIGGDKKAGPNLGTWPKGEKRAFTFSKSGVVPILCNVHPEMTGFVIVSPTPYFAETDDNGNYKIKDVPDGSYTLTAWHEGVKNQSKLVTVSGGLKQTSRSTSRPLWSRGAGGRPAERLNSAVSPSPDSPSA